MFRNPWWVVFGSVLGLMVGNGPVMQFTFGVFLKPISEEMGWERGMISLALNAGLVMTGLATPFAGRLMDKYGIRAITLPAIILFAIATAAVSLVSTSPVVFILLYAVMGLAAAGQTPLPYSKAIASWFDKRRGLALGIAIAGVGLGAAVVPKFTLMMMQHFGWRGAYLGLGLLIAALAIPAIVFLVRERPVSKKNDVAHLPEARGLSGREAIGSRVFWVMAVAFFGVAMAANGTIAHVVPLLTDRGITAEVATSALAVAGLALIAGRLLSGYLMDRFFAPYVAAVFFLAPLIGIVILLQAESAQMAAAGTVLVGVGLGAEVDLIAFLLTRYLGNRSFGEIYGYFFAIFMLGSGLGPMVMGVMYDWMGSYNTVMLVFIAMLCLSILLIARLGPYTYPVDEAHEQRQNRASPEIAAERG